MSEAKNNMTAAQFPHEQSPEGHFVRQDDAFRDWVRADGSSPYAPEAGRYHLYVSLACPWASRTVIVRKLKGLESAVGMTVVDPIRDERGWAFRDVPGATLDPVNGFSYLSEAYEATDPRYRGRVTVPVLWDTKTHRIVSNSDDDIMRMFETEFDALTGNPQLDLYPERLRGEIDVLNEHLYRSVNDGVYRAGFATSQRAYEASVRELFRALDQLEDRLSRQRYLFGASPVESDWRLFVTLVRFDPVYYVHFKCNLRLIAQYENLYGYLRDLYQIGGVAQTVDFDHIKRHYYVTHEQINPTRIVPLGPLQDLTAPHGRDQA
jgi:putative glutathione S-transferase